MVRFLQVPITSLLITEMRVAKKYVHKILFHWVKFDQTLDRIAP